MAILSFLESHERIARYKLGKYDGVHGPGRVWTIPFIHKWTKLDLRTQVISVPGQANFTKDEKPVNIDFLIHLHIMSEHVERAVLEVANYRTAVAALAAAKTRGMVSSKTLEELTSQSETINKEMCRELDRETDRWGIKIEKIEIRAVG